MVVRDHQRLLGLGPDVGAPQRELLDLFGRVLVVVDLVAVGLLVEPRVRVAAVDPEVREPRAPVQSGGVRREARVVARVVQIRNTDTEVAEVGEPRFRPSAPVPHLHRQRRHLPERVAQEAEEAPHSSPLD